MKYIIKVTNLVKRYKQSEKNAVDSISFTVKPGEFFTMLGPNGAGKTTTVSILSTTLSKTGGSVRIAGYDLDSDPSSVRKNIGIIFQNPSLDKNLTAEENIRFHASLYGLYPFRPSYRFMSHSYKNNLSRLADMLGIGDAIFQRVKTYSGGMKRKLEILRSILHNPKILFLDEPTSGLDPESRQNLWKYLLDLRKQQSMTIFLTTHYLAEAEGADTVCIINSGKIVTMGTPKDIKASLVDEYLILDSKDRGSLRKELTDKHIGFTEHRHIHVPLSHMRPQKIIASLKTKLSVLDIHTPTLEEAYLDVLSRTNGSGATDA